jgi:hypothetical protein
MKTTLLYTSYNRVSEIMSSVTLLFVTGDHLNISLMNTYFPNIQNFYFMFSRPQWPHGLRPRCVAAVATISCSDFAEGIDFRLCECCVLSGRGLCDGSIPRPEEFYRVSCVWVWSWCLDNEKSLAHEGRSAIRICGFVWNISQGNACAQLTEHNTLFVKCHTIATFRSLISRRSVRGCILPTCFKY